MNISNKLLLLILAFSLVPAMAATDALDEAIDKAVETNLETHKTQEKIEQLSEETRSMLEAYQYTLQQIDSLKTYNAQLEKLIKNQRAEKISILSQLNSIEETQRNIVPLMLRMIEVLEEFIRLDMPFLTEERQARLNLIKEMMDRPDVSLPDKYRRIMETYQIEMEYGRNIATEKRVIEINGQSITVETLRIGRLALLYQTLDGEDSGLWNKGTEQWESLPGKYNKSIAEGIRIAKKQSPPALFKIPVRLPEKSE